MNTTRTILMAGTMLTAGLLAAGQAFGDDGHRRGRDRSNRGRTADVRRGPDVRSGPDIRRAPDVRRAPDIRRGPVVLPRRGRVVTEQVLIEPAHYELRTESVLVEPGHFETICIPESRKVEKDWLGRTVITITPASEQRVWVPDRFETRTVRVLVPARYETRRAPVVYSSGRGGLISGVLQRAGIILGGSIRF